MATQLRFCLKISFMLQNLHGITKFIQFKPLLHMQFLLPMALQFQEIIALPSHVQIAVCSTPCAGNTTSSEKLEKY